MSPGVLRTKTARDLRRARNRYGDDHKATWAAYGRAIAAWGNADRIRSIAPVSADLELLLVASLAGVRASKRPGHSNRHSRRHRGA